jgi:hypothetical protein
MSVVPPTPHEQPDSYKPPGCTFLEFLTAHAWLSTLDLIILGVTVSLCIVIYIYIFLTK